MSNRFQADRRRLLRASGAAALLLAAPGLARAQSVDELMQPIGQPDVWLGDPRAPVTIIEYASMTCSHCAEFHAKTWPALKSKYIETGKVRFTLREFPLDPLAAAAFMLARCAGNDKRMALIDLLFDKQRDWTATDKPVEALASLTKQAGFTQEKFETCLKNQELYDGVNQVRDRASEKFGVNATPTFFINGKKQSGALGIEELDKIIAPLLKS